MYISSLEHMRKDVYSIQQIDNIMNVDTVRGILHKGTRSYSDANSSIYRRCCRAKGGVFWSQTRGVTLGPGGVTPRRDAGIGHWQVRRSILKSIVPGHQMGPESQKRHNTKTSY